jgi:signal transduction histidine kinase
MRYNDQFTIQLASDAGMVNNAKRFVYQLEGFNENWVKTSELNPNITYNSLSPGDYTLHVRMLNDDGTFGSEESTMEITIRPPFWRSRWMQLFYLLLVCVGIWFWRKWYVKYHARRVEAEELRRETEKLQWMSEMHMKMSKERAENPQAPLTSGEDGDKPAGLQLTLKEENIVEAIKDICKEFLVTPTGQKAKLSCQSMTDEIMGDIDHDKLAEALNILLTNSVRFAPGKCIVNINIGRSDKDHAVIQVADNGVGIRDEFKATAFDPMIGSEGIGLDKVKDIVVAHGGTIRLQDNPGGGTIFIISLPVQPEVVIEDAVMMDDDE